MSFGLNFEDEGAKSNAKDKHFSLFHSQLELDGIAFETTNYKSS